MCSQVGQGAGDPLVKGMFASIVLMVSMPAVLVLGVSGWFYHRTRRTAGEGDGAPPRVIAFRREDP